MIPEIVTNLENWSIEKLEKLVIFGYQGIQSGEERLIIYVHQNTKTLGWSGIIEESDIVAGLRLRTCYYWRSALQMV